MRNARERRKFLHLWVGTFIEARGDDAVDLAAVAFLHLWVGTFIEAAIIGGLAWYQDLDFSTFGWGLSLRPCESCRVEFFGGHFSTFGWGLSLRPSLGLTGRRCRARFLHLWVGTFIEAGSWHPRACRWDVFPSFWEGLSLR